MWSALCDEIWSATFKDPVGQVAHWLEEQQSFDFTVAHRAGTEHVNTGALFHRLCTAKDCCSCEEPHLFATRCRQTIFLSWRADTCFVACSAPLLQYLANRAETLNRVFAAMCKCLWMQNTHTTPLNPHRKSLVEKFNRTLAQQLAHLIAEH